jgi:hypothetical protein
LLEGIASIIAHDRPFARRSGAKRCDSFVVAATREDEVGAAGGLLMRMIQSIQQPANPIRHVEVGFIAISPSADRFTVSGQCQQLGKWHVAPIDGSQDDRDGFRSPAAYNSIAKPQFRRVTAI